MAINPEGTADKADSGIEDGEAAAGPEPGEGSRWSDPFGGGAQATDNSSPQVGAKRRFDGESAVAFGLLPAVALMLALGAGYLKWRDASMRSAEEAGAASLLAAKDGAVALLSYRPGSVEQDLGAARDRLTGTFRDSYSSLINDVVIPGAIEKQISATATIPASASVYANEKQAVAMIFVNQTTEVGDDAPTETASTIKVTLDEVDGRWLISGFQPI